MFSSALCGFLVHNQMIGPAPATLLLSTIKRWTRLNLKTPKKKFISLSNIENDSVTSKELFLDQRTTPDGRVVNRFETGFYSDGKTVYVDVGEILETYGIRDSPELRALVWSDLQEIFAGVPVQELREGSD